MTRHFPRLGLFLFVASLCHAQLPVETGVFRNFMGGVEPACAYDNWISHISEGIARPGYNAYAPTALDPQTNGFGTFEVLEDDAHGDAILSLFADLADSLLRDRGEGALARMQQVPDLDFDLLRFQDTETGGSFYMLREQLDTSYVDLNNTGTADDVTGSFRHGWGLFVFNPAAARPRWVVEAPHPNDDYPSSYLATDLFLDHGAGVLMVNGAGREVAYTGSPGAYTNSASLSDPSRNCLTPFAVIHERCVNFWREQGQLERTLQIHSYDDAAHRDLKSAVLSGGRNRRLNFSPLYDTGNGPTGLLNNLSDPVHAANALGFTHSAVSLLSYISTQSQNEIRVDGGTAGQEIWLTISPDLWGFPNSCQEADSHPAGYPDCHAGEDWVHVEMDELPTISHTAGTSFWYGTSSGTPVGWGNYGHSTDYFQPLFLALAEAEDSLAANRPTPAPTDPVNLSVTGVDVDAVDLAWTPTWSSHFESYEILADPSGTITPEARLFTSTDLDLLCWAPLKAVRVSGLDYRVNHAFLLRGLDQEGRRTAWTDTVYGAPDDLHPPLLLARYPTGHTRYWVPPGGGSIQVRVRDVHHQVDLSSLEVRVDQNNNGLYGTGEGWQDLGLSGFSRDTTITVTLAVTGTGIKRLEFHASDDQHGEILGCSGSEDDCGIVDDWRIGVDGTAPAAFNGPNLAALTSSGGITLSWPNQHPDSTFYTFELALASHAISQVEEGELRFTRLNYSNLGQAASTGLTLPQQPWIGDSVWVLARIVDAAGNAGAPGPPLVFRYWGGNWVNTELVAQVGLPLVGLSWSTSLSLPNWTVAGWWVHTLSEPDQTPDESTRLLYTQTPALTLNIGAYLPRRFLSVTTDIQRSVALAEAEESLAPEVEFPALPLRLSAELRLGPVQDPDLVLPEDLR
ncbi:MAG: hypothetical protein WC326_09460 [Candidatus Delongbacteria bacterium]